jgi:four helix bundle protein
MGGTYRDLEAWQCARALVVEIYRSTASFQREEMFGLTSQLRRAAVSVASNIAEGKGRFSDRELSQFLSVSRGSVFEIETQVTIALRSRISHCISKSNSLEAMRRGRAAAERPYQSREKACGVGKGGASGFGCRASGLNSQFGSLFHCYIPSFRRSVVWPKPGCRSPKPNLRGCGKSLLTGLNVPQRLKPALKTWLLSQR